MLAYCDLFFRLLFILFTFYSVNTFSQTNNSSNVIKGVSIAEDTLPPHPSALLDVRSINKGVLFPTVSYEQLNQISVHFDNEAENYGASVNGMVVFVNTANQDFLIENNILLKEIRGFYYWGHNSNNPENSDWIKIQEKSTIYPEGSIIMYSGILQGLFDNTGKGIEGTKMEGWAVCNGDNNTPNMTGKFIVGLDKDNLDYESVQNEGGLDYVRISENNFPKHSHDPVFDIDTKVELSGDGASHRHLILNAEHRHTYRFTKKEKAGLDVYQARRRNDLEVRVWRPRARQVNTEREIPSAVENLDLKVAENDASSTIALTDENVAWSNEDNNGNKVIEKPLDIRPPYYTVVYLMRISAGINNSCK